MVYFGRKLTEEQIEQIEQELQSFAKLGLANTFTANNTFNGIVSVTNKLEVKKSNNNGAFIENFDYNSKNYTSLKLFKNNNRNLLQIEVNNTDETATINSGIGTNLLTIGNLANPTNNNHAANKQYVDNLIKEKVITLSNAQWKNNINSNKCRVYGFTNNLSANQRGQVIGIELFVSSNWLNDGSNTYILSYASYNNNAELKVVISRADGQAISDTQLDTQQIKIRYTDNLQTV